MPTTLLLLQRLDARLVVPNGAHLRAEHDHGEDGEQESFEKEEQEENHGRGRGERVAPGAAPLVRDAIDKMVDAQEQRVHRDQGNVQGEQDEELLVVLPDAVVDPRAVVVHLPDATLADGAVVSPLGFDATALRALEQDLSLGVAHTLDHLAGRVALGDRAGVREHCSDVGRRGEERQRVENEKVDDVVSRGQPWALPWQYHL